MGAFDTYLKDRGTPSRSTGGAFNSFIKEKTGMDLSPLDKFRNIGIRTFTSYLIYTTHNIYRRFWVFKP